MSGKLPVDLQSFSLLREDDYKYIDKTEYIEKLVSGGRQYFLSRPRRFGKSLFLSALKAYWEGRKELFRGLAIEELTRDAPDAWASYPVFFFDFNSKNYQKMNALEDVLDTMLRTYEEIYGNQWQQRSIEERFQRLLVAAREQTGRRCVVLVDEYDKPLLETMGDDALVEHNKAVFKGFFSCLKSFDEYLQFVFITGVTKFSKVSIFSDLNQLNDISLDEKFSGICGMTERDLKETFAAETAALAEKKGISDAECLKRLKKKYDGYHFYPDSEGIYNPFSVLTALYRKDFGNYWFETGTPTFLVRALRDSQFDAHRFTDDSIYANEAMLSDYRTDNPDLVPLLYQTGYLTITDYDEDVGEYTLGFPNEEVKYGFLESLIKEYVPSYGAGSGTNILSVRRYIENGNLEMIRNVLVTLFARIPYTTNAVPFEHDFQSVIYILFTMLGQYVHCEMHTYTGRIDVAVEAKKFIYIFEFKRDQSAEEALRQIESRRYADVYAADSRRIYKIGVNFDSEKRNLTDWIVA